MLLHTRGILVMTPDSAMVLTGKQALDYSGGVSAEDNFGIGGYDRIMGPNGQAQYWAADLAAACEILFAHYEHTTSRPASASPGARRAPTRSTATSAAYPHNAPNSDFRTVGDIFSMETNPERKKPFDIRAVMRAVADQDHRPLERWAAMAGAESAVVFDAHLGGYPVTLLGIESRPLRRSGFLPADGPDQWTAGTLFPRSSKKVARAINAASGNRPAGGAGQPLGLRRLAGVAAQAAARVRRRDRPRGRQLRRPDRLLRRLPLPRRSLRGLLRHAQRQHGGDRRRGLVRVGHRRCAGGRDRLRPRGQRAHRRRSAGGRARGPPGRRGGRRASPAAGRAGRRRGLRCARTSSARWRPSSTASTPSSGRCGSVRSMRSSRPLVSDLTSSRLSSGGCGKHWSDLYRRRTVADQHSRNRSWRDRRRRSRACSPH